MKLLQKTTLILLVLLSIVSCLKSIYEPDIWWQIATGNWIIENRSVPTTDIFSYTYAGDPWINVKWGSEVIMAFVSNNFGVEFLGVLQAICILIIGLIGYKTSLYFKPKSISGNAWEIAFGFAFVIFLFVVNYRLNGRPEMFSHLFTAILIFLLIRYSRTNTWAILWIIPLQIIWTNMHEAYGVGMVVSGLFTLLLWIEYALIYKKHKIGVSNAPIKLSIASLASVLAVAINPQGFKMILHPFNILGQLNENKYTEELISYTMNGYWQYQAISMVLIMILILLYLTKTKGSLLLKPSKTIGLAPTLLLFAFLYLSLTSFRNIPFFMIAALPIMVVLFSQFLSQFKQSKTPLVGLLIIQVMFYLAIVSGSFYARFLPQEKYGLQIRAEMNPIGVSEFIKKEKIEGKGFVDYLSSSYFIFNNPGFKSYIDLRDLDVFPTNFFDNVFFIYQNPAMQIQGGGTPWQFADSVDQFNYVITLNNTQFQQFNRFMFHGNPDFTLVYADNLNSLFIRNTKQNTELIKKYGYKENEPIFRTTHLAQKNNLASNLSSFFYWGYKPEKKSDFNTRMQSNAYYQYLGIEFVN